MIRRKRSPLRYLIPALLVGGLLWWAHTWFARGGRDVHPGKMETVKDTLAATYEQLDPDFRAKVPGGEFAAMFHRMADPESEDLPAVRQATAFEASGPEPPRARFRVEYPPRKTRAEYHFSRVDGVWKLQSFTRVVGDWQPPVAMAKTPAPRPGTSTGVAPAPPAPGTGVAPGAPTPAVPAVPGAKFPCYYVVQPGDTLSSISRHFHGTITLWRQILAANPGLNPRSLRIGRRILIPSPPDHRPLGPRRAVPAGDGAR